jgi:hypothetical protein
VGILSQHTKGAQHTKREVGAIAPKIKNQSGYRILRSKYLNDPGKLGWLGGDRWKGSRDSWPETTFVDWPDKMLRGLKRDLNETHWQMVRASRKRGVYMNNFSVMRNAARWGVAQFEADMLRWAIWFKREAMPLFPPNALFVTNTPATCTIFRKFSIHAGKTARIAEMFKRTLGTNGWVFLDR